MIPWSLSTHQAGHPSNSLCCFQIYKNRWCSRLLASNRQCIKWAIPSLMKSTIPPSHFPKYLSSIPFWFSCLIFLPLTLTFHPHSHGLILSPSPATKIPFHSHGAHSLSPVTRAHPHSSTNSKFPRLWSQDCLVCSPLSLLLPLPSFEFLQQE